MNGISGRLSQFDASATQCTTPHARTPTSMRYRWLQSSVTGGVRQTATAPRSRSKHAACCYDGAIYMYGGKHGSVAYADLWRYDIASEVWTRMDTSGDRPPALQEHTIVAYKNKLYLFGGDFCYGSSTETPLWVLCLENLIWSKPKMDSEVMTPCSRRAHTAVIYDGAMQVFGGYIDLRGSSSEFWTFDLEHYHWHLAHSSRSGEMSSEDGPGGRHSHSALIYRDNMWVVGGMTDLVDRSDIWCWSFASRIWSRIKLRRGLIPDLRGHTACCLDKVMIVFGGTSQGALQSELWCFHFDSCVWQKASCRGITPEPRTNHCAVVVVPTTWGSHTSLPDVIQPSCQEGTSVGCFQNRVIPINVGDDDVVPDLVDVDRNAHPTQTGAATRCRSVYPPIGQSKRAYIDSLRQNSYMSYRNGESGGGVSIMLRDMSPVAVRGVDNPTFVAEFNIANNVFAASKSSSVFADSLRRIRAVSRNDLVVVDIESPTGENDDYGTRERVDSRAALLKNVDAPCHRVTYTLLRGDTTKDESTEDNSKQNDVDRSHWRSSSGHSTQLSNVNQTVDVNTRQLTCQSNLSRSTQSSDRNSDSDASTCSDSAYADDQSVSAYNKTSHSVTACHTTRQSATDVCERTVSADSGFFGPSSRHSRLSNETKKKPANTASDSSDEKFNDHSKMTGGAPYMLVLGGRVQEAQNIETKAMATFCLTTD